MSEKEIKSKIEEIELLKRILEERRSNLLKALELTSTQPLENIFEFDILIPKDSGPVKKFLISKILETFKQKFGINFKIIESNNFISSIQFSKCDEEQKNEIFNSCRWVQRVTKEKQEKEGEKVGS
jgi:hypothetical protein